jgi:hypothetical protein
MPDYSKKFINKLREVYTKFYADYDQEEAPEHIEKIIRFFMKNIAIDNDIKNLEKNIELGLLLSAIGAFLPLGKFLDLEHLPVKNGLKFPEEDIRELFDIYSGIDDDEIETNLLAIAIFKETKFYDEGLNIRIIKQIVRDSGLSLGELYKFIFREVEDSWDYVLKVEDTWEYKMKLILDNPKLLDVLNFYQFKCERKFQIMFGNELFIADREMRFPRFSECSSSVQQSLLSRGCINKSPEERSRCQTYMDAIVKGHKLCCIRFNDTTRILNLHGKQAIITAVKLNHLNLIALKNERSYRGMMSRMRRPDYCADAFYVAIEIGSLDALKILLGYSYYNEYTNKLIDFKTSLNRSYLDYEVRNENTLMFSLMIEHNRLEILKFVVENNIIPVDWLIIDPSILDSLVVDKFTNENLGIFEYLASRPDFLSYQFTDSLVTKICLADFAEHFKILYNNKILTDDFCTDMMASFKQNYKKAPKKIFEFLELNGY